MHPLQKKRLLPVALILVQLVSARSGLSVNAETRVKESKTPAASAPTAPRPVASPASSAPARGTNGAVASLGAPPPPGSVTVINAKKHLLLDAKGYQATFQGDVTVLDPRFSLSCDKLVAYLKRPSNGEKEQGGEKPQGAGAGEQIPKPAAGDGAAGQGGVEKAVAEGDVIIVQDKVNDKGESERSIARARKAVYDSLTGNITLSGMPQVEQRGNTIVAAEESTVMILNSKGSLEVLGQSKSVLRNTSTENGR